MTLGLARLRSGRFYRRNRRADGATRQFQSDYFISAPLPICSATGLAKIPHARKAFEGSRFVSPMCPSNRRRALDRISGEPWFDSIGDKGDRPDLLLDRKLNTPMCGAVGPRQNRMRLLMSLASCAVPP